MLELTCSKSLLGTHQFSKIKDYAIIGDCRSAALIARNGSLDWLCWPRFDSPPIFAGLLDRERGGFWQISPSCSYEIQRQYVGHTNVLETRFLCPRGIGVLTDLMPVTSESCKRQQLVADHEVLRQIECVSGELPIEVYFEPRAGFGQSAVQLRPTPQLGMRMEVGRGVYWLRSTHSFCFRDHAASASFCLRQGEVAQFSLAYTEDAPAVLCCLGDQAKQRIVSSIDWWEHWAARTAYEGPYREAVVRSALTLKLLAYAPSGAIIAAPTTSLPERMGGDLNWDYRYCWLRDASLTMRALLQLHHEHEADAFLSWMLHATRLTQPELRIFYTIFGEKAPRERELPHLTGYCDSAPVRVGNGARDQLQLDVYGEVIDAAAQYVAYGRTLDRMTQRVLIGWGKYVAGNWQRPDDGIWEPRSGAAHHTHSRLLCWTALDRLCKLSAEGALEGAPLEIFARERERLRREIRDKCWNSRLQSYVSILGGEELDASLLLLSWYGFEEASSERMVGTHRAIEHCLRAGPALLYRYSLEPPEGAFGICSFWETEYLALKGRLEDAQTHFETLLSYSNDVGLFAEEIDPASGDALGNLPQGFTHVGLISAALTIEKRREGKVPLPHREDTAEPRGAMEVAT